MRSIIYLLQTALSILTLVHLSCTTPLAGNQTLSFSRRAPDETEMSEWMDGAYRRFINWHKNMGRKDLPALVQAGYEQMAAADKQRQIDTGVKDDDLKPYIGVVSALLVPNVGAYLSSIPRGPTVTAFMDKNGALAPAWAHATSGRSVLIPEKSKYHAEDGACFYYESVLPQGSKFQAGNKYPSFTYIISYGLRSPKYKPSVVSPCTERDSNIDPACYDTLRLLNIDFS